MRSSLDCRKSKKNWKGSSKKLLSRSMLNVKKRRLERLNKNYWQFKQSKMNLKQRKQDWKKWLVSKMKKKSVKNKKELNLSKS